MAYQKTIYDNVVWYDLSRKKKKTKYNIQLSMKDNSCKIKDIMTVLS